MTKKRKKDKQGKKGLKVSAEYIELRDAIIANDVAALMFALDKRDADKCGGDKPGADTGDLDAVDKDLHTLLDAIDEDLRTLLGWTIKSDFLEGMELLLTKGATPDSRTTLYREGSRVDSETPLKHVSGSPSCNMEFYYETKKIMKNKLKMAECLIRHGADPNLSGCCDGTPLWQAIHTRDSPLVKLLLDAGADPFQCHSEFLPSSMEKALYRSAAPPDHCPMRSAQTNEEIFELIWKTAVEKGWTNKPGDRAGNTTLHLAAKEGLLSVVETILGTCSCTTAEIGIFNKNNETPLVVAISALELQTADPLLRLCMQPNPRGTYESANGALVTITPNAFQSPLFRAFRIVIDDGRHDNGINPNDPEFAAMGYLWCAQKRKRQRTFQRLCIAIAESGYPLEDEDWLDHSFDDLLLGAEGPMEFRDVDWENVSAGFVKGARATFDQLRKMRTSPMTLKSLTRLEIRRSLMLRSPCVVCRAERAGCESGKGKALGELIKATGIPEILQKYVLFDDWEVDNEPCSV